MTDGREHQLSIGFREGTKDAALWDTSLIREIRRECRALTTAEIAVCVAGLKDEVVSKKKACFQLEQ